MRVAAFDIDGMLTAASGMNVYERTRREPGVVVGIVTARSPGRAREFVVGHGLDPDFLVATDVKHERLRDLQREYSRARSFTYHGSYVRDRLAAWLAGWQYESPPTGWSV